MKKYNQRFLQILLIACLIAGGMAVGKAQTSTPHWRWAKGIGSDSEDAILGGIHLDSAGNVYQGMLFTGNTVTIGGQTYHNRTFGGGLGFMFSYAKYSPQGTLLWAKTTLQDNTGSSRIPNSMFVTPQGYSYLLYDFYDSLKVSGLLLKDTSIHNGYCIAIYDPAGSILSLKAKKTSSLSGTQVDQFYYFDESHILALGGGMLPDTLDGLIAPGGTFIALMDTSGTILRIKPIGYNSLTGGGITYHSPLNGGINRLCTNAKKSVYMSAFTSSKTSLDSSLHFSSLPSLGISGHANILLKFDSLLNYQWHRVSSNSGMNGQGIIASDPADNLYVVGGAGSNDTVTVSDLAVILPTFSNLQFALSLAKLNGSGTGQWIDTFVNGFGNRIRVSDMCTDKTGNSYIYGIYDNQFDIGKYRLTSYGEAYVGKVLSDGTVDWVQTSRNAQGNTIPSGIAEDGRGNLYINGIFGYNVHPFYGADSLVYHTPIADHPYGPDIFTARLGSCNPQSPTLTAHGPVTWCGSDSVLLSSTAANTHFWSTGDTTAWITVRQSGIYYVFAGDTLGCYAMSGIDTIKANMQLSFAAITSQNVKCFDGSDGHVSLQPSSSNGPVTYQYNPPIIDTIHVPAGSYIITAADSAGCMARDTLVMEQPAMPLTLHTDSIPTTSVGNGVAVVTATGGTPAYSYAWSNSQTMDTARNLREGWYRVTVTDRNGCQSVDSTYVRLTGEVGVEIVSATSIAIFPNPAKESFCLRTKFTASVSVYDGKFQLVQAWGEINEGENTLSIRGLAPGIYYVVIKTDNGFYSSKLTVLP
jgi:hypothetical protein